MRTALIVVAVVAMVVGLYFWGQWYTDMDSERTVYAIVQAHPNEDVHKWFVEMPYQPNDRLYQAFSRLVEKGRIVPSGNGGARVAK